jgi:hypothetical protein
MSAADGCNYFDSGEEEQVQDILCGLDTRLFMAHSYLLWTHSLEREHGPIFFTQKPKE